jgi:S-formylglutathione hydrolase FrmB
MIRALAAALVLGLLVPGAASAQLTETRRDQLSPRLLELGFTTPALPAETNVRILLPDGYEVAGSRRYPVLYLLHGCCDYDVDGSQAWTTHGEVEEATRGLPLIVVMPAAGRGGMYSDWLLSGTQGRPQWETYHLEQLVPWVDANFRTVPGREGRAIAGLSMGGFGAMKYAATHPDRFVFAASFSGIVDSNVDGGATHAVLPETDGGTPASVWGPRATDELRWRSQNPWDLAENLAPLRLELRTGNGEREDGGSDPVEQIAHRNSVSLHQRLDELKLAHVWDDYGAGTHTWPYWARGLRRSLEGMREVFASPPPRPRRVTYRSALPAYEVFGWKVAFRRSGLAWSRLVDAGRAGFTLEGEGPVTVRTPALFTPGRAMTVRIGSAASRIAADGDGRLTVPFEAAGRTAVRIAAPCTPRRLVRVRVPRRLEHARAKLDGRRVPIRRHRVRIDLRAHRRATARLVVTGRGRGGRRVRMVQTYRLC